MEAPNEFVLFDFENQLETAVKTVLAEGDIKTELRLSDAEGEKPDTCVVVYADLGQATGHQHSSNNGSVHLDSYQAILTIGFDTAGHARRESDVSGIRKWRHEIRARIRHLLNRKRGWDLINAKLPYHVLLLIDPLPLNIEIIEARNVDRDGIQYAIQLAIKPESWPSAS